MSDKEFSVVFDGPAAEAGLIDVTDLAPALLGLGDLLRSANQVLNGDGATVHLKVRANPRVGSFEIDLQVALNIAAQVKAFLAGDGGVAAERLFDLIIKGSVAGGSLIALIKWLRRRKPDSTTTLKDGNVEITVASETKVFAPQVVLLYNDARTRDNAAKLTRPLQRERIDKIEFREDSGVVESISASEAGSFEPVDETETPVSESERVVALMVVTATFDDTRFWRMSDGSSTFNVGVEDTLFRDRVDSGEVSFKKNDILRVRLRTEQTLGTGDKLSTRHTIVEVLEKLEGPEQIPLFTPRD